MDLGWAMLFVNISTIHLYISRVIFKCRLIAAIESSVVY
jgi:hypothetical protein